MLIEIVSKHYFNQISYPYWFVSDSNRLLPLLIAVCSFMWFKDVKIPYSKWINAIGGATFGVLLIHANSDAMRQWLWKETVDCTGHYAGSVLWVLGYSAVSVLIIFIICTGIDWFRGKYIEPYYLKKAEQAILKLTSLIKR